MNERFDKIPAAEKDSILQAAFTEFADKGYRRASTNKIVENANIPKGTLFYYFGSKKNLFLYLLDAAVDNYVVFVNEDKTEVPGELFERLLYREQIKLRFAVENPLLFRFFSKVFLDIPEEIKTDLVSRFQKYNTASADNLLEGIDKSRFREEVDIEEAVQMIHMLLQGIFAHYSPHLKAAQADEFEGLIREISAECRRYFGMVQSGIYHQLK